VKCRHGILGKCPQCEGALDRDRLLMEVAKLVAQLADSAGLDTSGLEAMLRKASR
jgi:hypothetical protein